MYIYNSSLVYISSLVLILLFSALINPKTQSLEPSLPCLAGRTLFNSPSPYIIKTLSRYRRFNPPCLPRRPPPLAIVRYPCPKPNDPTTRKSMKIRPLRLLPPIIVASLRASMNSKLANRNVKLGPYRTPSAQKNPRSLPHPNSTVKYRSTATSWRNAPSSSLCAPSRIPPPKARYSLLYLACAVAHSIGLAKSLQTRNTRFTTITPLSRPPSMISTSIVIIEHFAKTSSIIYPKRRPPQLTPPSSNRW